MTSTMDDTATTPADDATGTATEGAGGVHIREIDSAGDAATAVDLLQRVWGSPTELVRLEMMMAISHAGGYVSAAVDDSGAMVGTSVGILARHRGQAALHSHVTGLLPEARGTGIGRALKLHQLDWAADRGLEWIVWTFDPLVRRNAWFNIAVLGVRVEAYLERFYGEMSDAINAGDESDRLYVAWHVPSGVPAAPRDGRDTPVAGLVPTPEDVVELRRTDPRAVARWRHTTRADLSAALAAGRQVVGFTRAGEYVLEPPPVAVER